MNPSERFEQRLGVGLETLAEPRFPDYLDDVLAVTSRRRQRPAWTFPGRWIPMLDIAVRPVIRPALPWRGIALVLLAILLALAVAIVVGSRPRLPAPFGPAANGLLAYESSDGISVVDAPAGTSRHVDGTAAGDHSPMWSPNGRLIAFSRGPKLASTLAVVSIDGGPIRQLPSDLVSNGGADPHLVAWSP